jgi:hypothetical protein
LAAVDHRQVSADANWIDPSPIWQYGPTVSSPVTAKNRNARHFPAAFSS